jgi:predicted RecA/RadA family phage recombinase
MAQNYISRGEVIALTAGANYTSGIPYRISDFNGVALISVETGEQLSFQLEGIFEFTLKEVKVGDLIYIGSDNSLVKESESSLINLFGRAVTSSDMNNKFYCRLLQS